MSVGTDTVLYQEIFYTRFTTGSLGFLEGSEFLFSSLYQFLYSIGASFRTVMMIQSALFLGPIGWVILKQGGRPVEKLLFLYLLGFYFASFNIARQSIAISFAFLGYYFLEKKKYIPYLLSFFVALGFHVTSILFLFVVVLRYINLKRYWVILILFLSYIIPIFVDMSFLSALVISDVDAFEAYTRYIDREGAMKGGAIPVTGTIMTLLYMYITYYYGDENREKDLFYKISVFSVILTNILFVSPTWTTRIIMYFSVAQVPFLSRFAKRSTHDRLIIYSYAIVYFIYYYIIQNYNEVKPYVFDISFNV